MLQHALRLKNSPLVHVLTQVAFPPVPSWTERVPELRKSFYDNGFQHYRDTETTEVMFEVPGRGGAPNVHQRAIPFHEFADRDGRFAFQLTEAAIVLHTTGYKDFQHFTELLSNGLRLVRDVLGIHVVSRIGLRYVDLVQAGTGSELAQFVKPGLLGFPFREVPELGVALAAFNSHTVGRTSLGALAVRSMTLPPGQYLPHDLDIAGLRPPERVQLTQPSILLDFDHYSIFTGAGASVPPIDFDVEAILRHVEQLHGVLKAAFLASVTDLAIKHWGPWEAVPV